MYINIIIRVHKIVELYHFLIYKEVKVVVVEVYKIDMNLHKCIRMLKKHYNQLIKINKLFIIIQLID